MCRNGYGCKRTNTKRRTPTSPTIHSHFDTTTYVRTYTSLTITNPLKNKPTYVRARVRVYVRKCVYVCTYVRTYVCMRVRTYVCMYACMPACACIHVRAMIARAMKTRAAPPWPLPCGCPVQRLRGQVRTQVVASNMRSQLF